MGLAEIVHIELVNHVDCINFDARLLDHRCRLAAQPHHQRIECSLVEIIHQHIDRLYLVMAQIGDDAAQCRGDAGEARHQGRRQPHFMHQRTGMQCASAAERHDGEAGRIMPAFDRHQPDRPCHPRIGDPNNRFGRRHHIDRQRFCDMAGNGALGGFDIQRGQLAADRARRIDTPQHDIGIGQRRAVIALRVTDRTGHRARAFGPDLQHAAFVDMGNGAAACADGGNLDHRRADHQTEIYRRLRGQHRPATGDQ